MFSLSHFFKVPNSKLLRFFHSFLLPLVLKQPLQQGTIYKTNQIWGTTRSIINNIILGCVNEFKKTLKLVGTGYKASLQGKIIKISAGYSHDIEYPVPEGINIKCADPNTIEISGQNKSQVGQVAADIRSFRKPEPYKGKGIQYENEHIHRKEGKKK